MNEVRIVAEQATLEEYCRAWRDIGCLAFDTEFIRDETYEAALCLIQVAAAGEVVLIDPTGDLDVGAFWDLVTDPAVMTVIHAGKEDFEVCLRKTGRSPADQGLSHSRQSRPMPLRRWYWRMASWQWQERRTPA